MSGRVWSCLEVSRRVHIEIQRNALLKCIFGGLEGGRARGACGGILRTVDKDGFMYGNPRCRDIEMLMTP